MSTYSTWYRGAICSVAVNRHGLRRVFPRLHPENHRGLQARLVKTNAQALVQ